MFQIFAGSFQNIEELFWTKRPRPTAWVKEHCVRVCVYQSNASFYYVIIPCLSMKSGISKLQISPFALNLHITKVDWIFYDFDALLFISAETETYSSLAPLAQQRPKESGRDNRG